MAKFKIISQVGCGWCEKAKALITALGYDYEEDLLDTQEKKDAFKAQGFTTVPQIYRGNLLMGGYDSFHRAVQERLAW